MLIFLYNPNPPYVFLLCIKSPVFILLYIKPPVFNLLCIKSSCALFYFVKNPTKVKRNGNYLQSRRTHVFYPFLIVIKRRGKRERTKGNNVESEQQQNQLFGSHSCQVMVCIIGTKFVKVTYSINQ